jgi:O-antigen/teichoic acid export membrane protein
LAAILGIELMGMKPRGFEEQVQILGKGAGINLAGKLFGRGLHFACQLILARWMGPATFGLYAIGWNILRVASILLPLGMDNGVISLGAPKWPRDKRGAGLTAATATGLTLIIGLMAGAAFYVASPAIAALFRKPDLTPILRIFAVAVPFASSLKVAAAATRVTKRMSFGIYAEEIFQPITNLILIAFLSGVAWILTGATWAVVISFAVGFILASSYIAKSFGELILPKWELIKIEISRLVQISSVVGAATIFATLVLLVDRVIVGYFLAEQEAGIYQAVSLFSVFFVTVLSAFKIIVAPMIASYHSQGQANELEELFRVSTRWVLYLSLPAFAVIFLAPENAISAVFGPAYSPGALSLVVLTMAQLANSATGAIEHFLIMTQNQKSWLAISSFMFVANLLLNFTLVPRFGLLGAAIATLVTFAGISVLCLVEVKRRVGIWPYDKRYLKGIAASIVMMAVLWLIEPIRVDSTIFRIIFLGACAYLSFAFGITVTGLDKEDRHLIELIKRAALREGA